MSAPISQRPGSLRGFVEICVGSLCSAIRGRPRCLQPSLSRARSSLSPSPISTSLTEKNILGTKWALVCLVRAAHRLFPCQFPFVVIIRPSAASHCGPNYDSGNVQTQRAFCHGWEARPLLRCMVRKGWKGVVGGAFVLNEAQGRRGSRAWRR